jgi:hypothetical protein
MSIIMIKCLATGQAVSTGMATDQAAWQKLADDWAGEAVICPACHTMHAWIKSDAFLDVFRTMPRNGDAEDDPQRR